MQAADAYIVSFSSSIKKAPPARVLVHACVWAYFAFFSPSSHASLLVWTGNGSDNNVATAGNWNSNQAPVTGDALLFTGTVGLAPQASANFSVDSISFDSAAGAFILGGGGKYTLTGSSGITNNSSNTETINNDLILGIDQTWTAASGNLVIGGNVNTNAHAVTFAGNFDSSVSKIISGTGGLTKSGSGTLTLSASNTFTGTTTVNSGVLALNNSSALAGPLVVGDNVSAAGSATVRNLQTSAIGSASSVTVNPSGVLDLNGLADKITNLTLVTGDIAGASVINSGTQKLTLNSDVTVNVLGSGAVGATMSGNLIDGGVARTFNVNDGAANADLTISAVLQGAKGYNKSGAGRLVLSGANTNNGTFTINAGPAQLQNANAINSFTKTIVNAGGALEFAGGLTFAADPVTVNGSGVSGTGAILNVNGTNSFSGAFTIGSATTFGSNSGSLTLSNTFSNAGFLLSTTGAGNLTFTGVINGTGGLSKNGSGNVTLTGLNTYTGGTTVNNGTLTLAAAGNAIKAGTSVTVNAGGILLLGASDQIASTSNITLAGGTFAKGNFSEGATNAVGAGTLTLALTGSHIDFGTGTTGVLSFASFSPGGLSIIVDNWTGTANTVGNSLTDRLIFNSDQAANLSNFNFTGFYSGATEFVLGGGFYEVVPVTPVPEPAQWLAPALPLGLAIVHLIRMRRKALRREEKTVAA